MGYLTDLVFLWFFHTLHICFLSTMRSNIFLNPCTLYPTRRQSWELKSARKLDGYQTARTRDILAKYSKKYCYIAGSFSATARALIGYFEVTWHLPIKLFPVKSLWAGNIAKSMTSESNSALLPANVDQRPTRRCTWTELDWKWRDDSVWMSARFLKSSTDLQWRLLYAYAYMQFINNFSICFHIASP